MDKNKVKIIIGLAEIFNFRFSEASLSIYMKALESISFDDLDKIINEGLMSNRWQFMPKPGEFFTSGDKQILDDSRDAANLTWSAIAKFGRNNFIQAREYVGELAWLVVERMGGWSQVCEVNSDEKGIWIAQFRDLTQSMSRKHEHGNSNRPPELPRVRTLTLIENKKAIKDLISSVVLRGGDKP